MRSVSYDDEPRRARYTQHNSESGEKALLKWILGIVSTLLVAAILGAWQQSIQIAELRSDVRNLQYQVNALTQRVNARYRGGDPDAN